VASLGDLTLFVSAETKRAQQDIQGLGKEADKVTGKKREIDFSLDKARNSIRDFKRDLETVGKTAKAAFKVAKMEGVFDDEIESAELLVKKTKQVGGALNEARKPGQLLSKTFQEVAGGAVGIVNALAKVGFALYGIQQVTGVLKQAFGGLFNSTVGESIRLQESILKTQTALASTNEILRNGEVITDPYEAIVALTGTIEQRIASIRDRSLELAGVTSNEVIEVFGMVAQQIGSIGGSLKDAEDLAISFAGALGTFGIPLYQARQEIGSILRGDITTDSYLAKSLGITNEDVAKAKNSTEGVVGFLEKRLQTAVAGQKIAAQSFAGVASNIADFQELFGQAFGDGLVQPLIDGLTKVYDLLVLIKDNALVAATSLGNAVGGASRILGGAASSGAASRTGGSAATAQASQRAQEATQQLSKALTKLALDIRKTFEEVSKRLTGVVTKLAKGLGKLGAAFVSLNVEVFRSLLETFNLLLVAVEGFSIAFKGALEVYAGFLSIPLVQTLAGVGAQFKLLETIGVGSLVKLALTGGVLIASFAKLKAAIATVAAFFSRAMATALATAGSALQAFGIALDLLVKRLGLANTQLGVLATQLTNTGARATTAAGGMKGAAGAATLLGNGIKGMMIKMLAFNALLLVIQLAIAAVVQAFAEFEKSRKQARALDEFNESMTQLNTTFKDVNENSTAAAQALKEATEASAAQGIKTLKNSFVEADKKVQELTKSVKELKEATHQAGFFEAFFADPAGSLRREQTRLKNALAEREKAETDFNEANAKHQALLNEQNLAEDITNRAREHGKLNEELAKSRDQHNESIRRREFSAQQEVSRKRLELFQAEENFRIQQLEARNRKLIEGEEGASAAALSAFNDYISQRERGELDLESQKRDLIIANADVEEQIANYKYDLEQKILELKKKGLKMATVEAELAGKREEAAAANVALSGIEGAVTTPTPTAADLGLSSAGGFANAKRTAQALAQQILSTQALSQGFVDQQNLDNIVKQLLPAVPLENFKDSIEQSTALITELGKGIAPEAAKNNAQLMAENAINQREVTETLAVLREELAQHPNIYAYLQEEILKRYNGKGGILQQLQDEASLRAVANERQRQANSIMGLQEAGRRGTLQTDQNIIQGRAQMGSGLTVDLFERNRIAAQGRIESRFAEMQSDAASTGGQISAEEMQAFKEFAELELFNAERQAEMDGLIERFNQLGTAAAGVGDAISTAMTQGFADIINGSATTQDVLSSMFEGIGQSFMKLAQQIIADMIKMLVFKTLLGLFGGGGMPTGIGIGTGGGAIQNPFGQIFGTLGPNYGIPQAAKGGIASAPTVAMVGEGSMNEAIVPMPDGKAIPVDLKGMKGAGNVNSNVTVNVSNEGGGEQIDNDGAGKLGKAIDTAIRKVIMDERRSGGLLYSGR
jgi:hypothetical protein